MSTSSKLKIALLIGAIMAVVAFVLKVAFRASPDELEAHTDDPAPDYETAMKWFEQLQAQEAAMDGLNPVCLSTVLTHGHKTERAIILMHGNYPPTSFALPQILQILKQRGLRPVTLSELLG